MNGKTDSVDYQASSYKIFFKHGLADLDSDAKEALDRIGVALTADIFGGKFVARGFAQQGGDTKADMALAKQRANNVASYLQSKGLSSSRMSVEVEIYETSVEDIVNPWNERVDIFRRGGVL